MYVQVKAKQLEQRIRHKFVIQEVIPIAGVGHPPSGRGDPTTYHSAAAPAVAAPSSALLSDLPLSLCCVPLTLKSFHLFLLFSGIGI